VETLLCLSRLGLAVGYKCKSWSALPGERGRLARITPCQTAAARSKLWNSKSQCSNKDCEYQCSPWPGILTLVEVPCTGMISSTGMCIENALRNTCNSPEQTGVRSVTGR